MQKEPQKTTHQATQSDRSEAFFCLWMLLIAVFEIVLLTVLLVRTLQKPENPELTPPDEGGLSGEDLTNEPAPEIPVFSTGVIPTLPAANADTKSLGSAIYSRYAVLIDAETGIILGQKDADTQFSPASLTKVMTLIIACEHFNTSDLDQKLILTQEVTDYVTSGAYKDASVALIDGDKYLGDAFLIRDLLYGIGVESAADCTYMIAKEISGSEEAFVALMNAKATEMGLTHTHFDNAIGHESENNYTTAREMAAIMMYAMQCELISDILGVESYNYQGHYTEDGVAKTYSRAFYSTLFRSRMETYKKYAGKEFKLDTVKLIAGKTGSFITSSYMVCMATKSTQRYILVLGDAPKIESASAPASYYTMCDIKVVFDTYIK